VLHKWSIKITKNLRTDKETKKKVSVINYYSYRLIIHKNAENQTYKCRQLLLKYIVDRFAKIEKDTTPIHSVKSNKVVFRRIYRFT